MPHRPVLGARKACAYIVVMSDVDLSDHIGGTPRATRRPAHVRAPAEWTNDPIPAPAPVAEDSADDQPGGRNPVRYGDWEYKGLAIDF